MYHIKEGWSIERHANDGSVTIYHPKPGIVHEWDVRKTKVKLDINADTWASIVAQMSHRGETAETFAQALRFHKGGDA